MAITSLYAKRREPDFLMLRLTVILVFINLSVCNAQDNVRLFFQQLKRLEYEKAEATALQEKGDLREEMLRIVSLLSHKTNRPDSVPRHDSNGGNLQSSVSFLQTLHYGYTCLFLDQKKGDAFKNFYNAYQIAKSLDDETYIKAALLAMLEYFKAEIAQNSDAYQPYLNHLKQIASDPVDHVWAALYEIIFYTKALDHLNAFYFKIFDNLDEHALDIGADSRLHFYILYEKALKSELEGDLRTAVQLFQQVREKTQGLLFFQKERFNASLKLVMISIRLNDLINAGKFLKDAQFYQGAHDSLRSSYYLNLYSSFYYNAIGKNDSAFNLLKLAYQQDFQLDFRRNTLEINRLNVQLETQEKENQNLKLKQSRLWLTLALVGSASLLLVSYVGYANQRAKNRVYLKEKEVQAMKMEKLLKDQEISGIDAMLVGQEKERQRIANELHDNLGSLLATLKFHFHNLRNNHQEGRSLSLDTADELIEEAYQKVRGLAHMKNAGVSAQEGLVPAVRHFANKVSIMDQLVIEVKEHGMDKRLDNTLEITVFRIIQELITNIIKHARATEAVIHLTQYEQAINIMVEDNGVGFNTTEIQPKQSMGLYSITKRIEGLGGQVAIESVAGKGTTVIIDVPLA